MFGNKPDSGHNRLCACIIHSRKCGSFKCDCIQFCSRGQQYSSRSGSGLLQCSLLQTTGSGKRIACHHLCRTKHHAHGNGRRNVFLEHRRHDTIDRGFSRKHNSLFCNSYCERMRQYSRACNYNRKLIAKRIYFGQHKYLSGAIHHTHRKRRRNLRMEYRSNHSTHNSKSYRKYNVHRYSYWSERMH